MYLDSTLQLGSSGNLFLGFRYSMVPYILLGFLSKRWLVSVLFLGRRHVLWCKVDWVVHDWGSERVEEHSVKWFCEEIGGHVGCWTVVILYTPFFDLVSHIEIFNFEMTSALAGRTFPINLEPLGGFVFLMETSVAWCTCIIGPR